MKSVCSFLCLPKETNQRKGTRVTCPAVGGMPSAPQSCRDVANSLRSNSVTSLFGSFSGARLRTNGIFLPHLSCRASQTGADKDAGGKRRLRLFEGTPQGGINSAEFFRVLPSSRSKGSPQGQDWLGCLFLVSSFGHAKEEREDGRKVISIFPEISKGIPTKKAGALFTFKSKRRCSAINHPVTGFSMQAFVEAFHLSLLIDSKAHGFFHDPADQEGGGCGQGNGDPHAQKLYL